MNRNAESAQDGSGVFSMVSLRLWEPGLVPKICSIADARSSRSSDIRSSALAVFDSNFQAGPLSGLRLVQASKGRFRGRKSPTRHPEVSLLEKLRWLG